MDSTQRSARKAPQTEQTTSSSGDLSRQEAPVAQPLGTETIRRAHQNPYRLSSGDVLQLQRVIGNQAVQRLLADRRAAPSPPNVVEPGRGGVDIQRVTEYDEEITDYLDTSNFGAFQSEGREVSGYLSSLNKSGIRGWRKRRQQRKVVRELVDLGPAPEGEWGQQAHTAIRSILVAELAAGQDQGYVNTLKRLFLWMLQAQGQSAVDTITDWFRGKDSAFLSIRRRINDAEPEFLNKMGRHNSEGFDSAGNKLNQLGPAIKLTQQNIKNFPDDTRQSEGYLVGARNLHKATVYYFKARTAWEKRRWYDMTDNLEQATTWYARADEQLRSTEVLKHGKYVTEFETGQTTKVGGGQFSKVYKVGFKDDAPGSITKGYFKSEQREYEPWQAPAAEKVGIPTFGSNFSNRAVAAYRLDKLFGFGLVPKTQFAVHKGVFGTVMEEAQGKSPQKLTKFTDEDGQEDEKIEIRDFNLDDFELLRGLSGLQLFDAIIGQVDRHAGNYLVEQGDNVETQIHAIDNDLAFGVKNTDVSKASSSQDKYRGLPKFVDIDLAKRVLSVTEDQVRAVIEPLLTTAEVAVTVSRFSQVKAHLINLSRNTAKLHRLALALRSTRDILKEQQKSGVDVDQKARNVVARFKQLRAELLKEGALLNRGEWDQEIADLHDSSSYYGLLKMSRDLARARGNIIPVDSD